MWTRISTLVFIAGAVTGISQSAPSQQVSEIDLKPLGVTIPHKGTASATSIELLFLSDKHLVLLVENSSSDGIRNARLVLYEIDKGVVYPKMNLNLSEFVLPVSLDGRFNKVLEWTDSEHFAYWTYSRHSTRWLCDIDLNCRQEKETSAPVPSPHAPDCDSSDLLGFIDNERAVCLLLHGHAKFSAIVMDSSGRHLYEVAEGVLPWDARMINSAQGQRFGLEWKTNTFLQLLEPLACIDECPPAGKQQFMIFSANDGKVVQNFTWDPRPYNLYVLPALSPSGNTAAFVKRDKLVIYSLNELR